MLDNITSYVILYGCKREKGILPTKKESIKEKNKNGNENWKSHYCGYRVY